jgi:hypothetical protein
MGIEILRSKYIPMLKTHDCGIVDQVVESTLSQYPFDNLACVSDRRLVGDVKLDDVQVSVTFLLERLEGRC